MTGNVSYKLDTTVEDARIIQELSVTGPDGTVERLSRWVANTADEGVRKALIGMGWTPPSGKHVHDWKVIGSDRSLEHFAIIHRRLCVTCGRTEDVKPNDKNELAVLRVVHEGTPK